MSLLYNPGKWDVFICYASEDKEDLARPLAESLTQAGLKVWFDSFEIKVGDSIERSIKYGIANSKYGIIIIGKSFYSKKWTQDELSALATKGNANEKVLLPILHGVTVEDIKSIDPIIVDRHALNSNIGISQLTKELLSAMNRSVKLSDHLQERIKSFKWLNEIRRDLEYILLNEHYPTIMSLSGDLTPNPIWERRSDQEYWKNLYNPSGNTPPIIKTGDIFLICADNINHAPQLLTYFSNKPKSGWNAWLLPFRHYLENEDERDRIKLNEKDIASFFGLKQDLVVVSSLGTQYMISVKPDPPHKDLKIYIYRFCSVELIEPPEWLSTIGSRYPLELGDREFHWYHPEDLERIDRTMDVDADVVRAVHHFFGTTIPNIPESVPFGFLRGLK